MDSLRASSWDLPVDQKIRAGENEQRNRDRAGDMKKTDAKIQQAEELAAKEK
jgi:hypothetical protein